MPGSSAGLVAGRKRLGGAAFGVDAVARFLDAGGEGLEAGALCEWGGEGVFRWNLGRSEPCFEVVVAQVDDVTCFTTTDRCFSIF